MKQKVDANLTAVGRYPLYRIGNWSATIQRKFKSAFSYLWIQLGSGLCRSTSFFFSPVWFSFAFSIWLKSWCFRGLPSWSYQPGQQLIVKVFFSRARQGSFIPDYATGQWISGIYVPSWPLLTKVSLVKSARSRNQGTGHTRFFDERPWLELFHRPAWG